MHTKTGVRRGLRLRLYTIIALLALAFSFFSSLVLLQIQRTGNLIGERQDELILFYVLLNAIVLSIIAVFWLSRTIVRPLVSLAKNMTDVASPSQFRPLPVRRWDEIGQLQVSFNNLMQRLGKAEEENRRQLSELTDAYSRLTRAQDQLITTEKLASLGRLSAGIAHEIGNPLSAVAGYLRLLPDVDDEVERKEMIERATLETSRIDKIIRSLLSFSRPRSAEDFQSPAELIETTISGLRVQPLFQNITIHTDVSDELPPVPTASGALEQVLLNLAVNAADAMGGKGNLELSASRLDTGSLRIEVRDDGQGIDEEQQRLIFDPFFTTKPPGKGTGLGLAICHQIVTALGGSISVTSSLGEGTTFFVDLPADAKEDRA